MGDENSGFAVFGDLEAALDEEKVFADDGEAVLVEGFAGDEEVGDTEFVFERDEAVSFSGAGALAADDHTGDLDGESVGEVEDGN